MDKLELIISRETIDKLMQLAMAEGVCLDEYITELLIRTAAN